MSDNVKDYSGASIEVLKGLEPVRRRPGMYTDTQNPNHLGMEVIDNSVDEAVAGFANKIDVVLYVVCLLIFILKKKSQQSSLS